MGPASLLLLAACGTPVATPPPEPAEPPASALPAEERFATRSAEIMSTRIDVRLPAEHIDVAEAVFEVFREVETTANEWRPESPLAAVNAGAGGEPVPVPAELRALVRRGVEIGAVTGGAFDVTWAALWGLWDFGDATTPRVPDPAEIAPRVALVDYRAVEIDEDAGTVRLARPDMAIGLGGIAKGWALDRSAALLRERGVEDFSLSAGGQVVVGGQHGDRPWRVGIRDPRGTPSDFFAVVDASDTSVSTSGDYERFFVVDGVRYHHILDPRTGYPTRGLRSASVVTPDATLADALSTAVMVLGPVQGMALVDSVPEVEAVLVDEAGAVTASAGAHPAIVHPPRIR